MEKIKMFIADDNAELRNILCEYYENQEDIDIVGVA